MYDQQPDSRNTGLYKGIKRDKRLALRSSFFKEDSRAIFSVISDENLEERCILPLQLNVPHAEIDLIDLISVIGLPLNLRAI